MVSQEKQEELKARMERLDIKEEELVEKFITGSGSGGQKINKSSTCVYLKHLPSGLEVKCQKVRSRERNRFYARRQLCDKLEGTELIKAEKVRRQKKRRQRRRKADPG